MLIKPIQIYSNFTGRCITKKAPDTSVKTTEEQIQPQKNEDLPNLSQMNPIHTPDKQRQLNESLDIIAQNALESAKTKQNRALKIMKESQAKYKEVSSLKDGGNSSLGKVTVKIVPDKVFGATVSIEETSEDNKILRTTKVQNGSTKIAEGEETFYSGAKKIARAYNFKSGNLIEYAGNYRKNRRKPQVSLMERFHFDRGKKLNYYEEGYMEYKNHWVSAKSIVFENDNVQTYAENLVAFSNGIFKEKRVVEFFNGVAYKIIINNSNQGPQKVYVKFGKNWVDVTESNKQEK